MKKVRIDLIEVGNIARLHALGYANAPNAELYTVSMVSTRNACRSKRQSGGNKGVYRLSGTAQ